jgi:D-sedoheptulose 7-phosphate isomerase
MTHGLSAAAYLDAHRALAGKLDLQAFEAGVALIRATFEAGRQIITCGNGGSAYAASHFITDWNKMVTLATGKKFRGISLCDNLGMVTAFANDTSFEEIFVGQLRAILEPGDLVIAVSGSGNSPNVIKAIEYANDARARTLALVGYDGGRLKQIAAQTVWVPSFDMQLCEDVHLMFGHVVMKALCGASIRD